MLHVYPWIPSIYMYTYYIYYTCKYYIYTFHIIYIYIHMYSFIYLFIYLSIYFFIVFLFQLHDTLYMYTHSYKAVCCETLAGLVDDELFRQWSRDWLQSCFRALGCSGWMTSAIPTMAKLSSPMFFGGRVGHFVDQCTVQWLDNDAPWKVWMFNFFTPWLFRFPGKCPKMDNFFSDVQRWFIHLLHNDIFLTNVPRRSAFKRNRANWSPWRGPMAREKPHCCDCWAMWFSLRRAPFLSHRIFGRLGRSWGLDSYPVIVNPRNSS